MFHRSGFRALFSLGTWLTAGIGLVMMAALPALAQDSPVIDVWYGTTQQFGQIGAPQPWANVLGNVSDANGISSLTYTLNGGPDVDLTVGPDGRRLQSSGDFNIDLATADLLDGSNAVVITAVDNDSPSYQTVVTVTVNYDLTGGNVWPLPYSVDWSTATSMEDSSQVVDGLWEVTPGGTVRTTIPGYDRLIAMGDMSWDDYEVTVPITLHSAPSDLGTGILMRWNGHTDYPISGTQPKSGYLPLGAICWYRSGRLELYGNDGDILATSSRTLSLDVAYMFKARVETIPGVGGLYSLKVWEDGQPEPPGWDITGQEQLSDPQNGSMMLISHKADASFGTVTINPVPLTISNIAVSLGAGNTEATVTWTTDEPATSSVDYGPTAAYENGTVSDPALVTDHSLTLTGLTPDMLYHYQITSVDGLGNPATTGDRTFSTIPTGIVSDDFSAPGLDPGVWTFVDPLLDGSYALSGTNTTDAWVNISVPAGTEHQVWDAGIKVPHILQSVNNGDFEIEVKFESSVDQQFQEQGILIKQDDGNYMRFELFASSTSTVMFTATFESMVPNTRLNNAFDNTGVAPLYMRVGRVGDQWTQTYSYDGTIWLNGVTFTHAITVTGIGLYAGNASGTGSPAHTASFDYFFDTASPVDPEDPILPWSISDIQVTPTETSATVTWTTDLPTDSSVAHGLTTGYELGSVSDPAYVTAHSITLNGLDAGTTYHFQVTSVDPSSNILSSPDMTFSTMGSGVSGIVSDDFSSATLDTGLWTLVDPLGDVVFSLTGHNTADAWANLSVPAGVEHQVDLLGIQAPHLLQSANDTDFEIEVKFESPISPAYQEQGVVIKQDDTNYMRFEFFSTATSTVLYARGYTPSTSPTYVNTTIGSVDLAPLYMRIKRTGDLWTLSHSFDGDTWVAQTPFTHGLTVAGLGPYSGNAVGATSPSHTASIDYFFNTASPIIPEDPTLPWNISNIQVTPDETSATVTWNTDQPTDSSVAHGLTTGYELGSVSDPAYVTAHSITLTGLDANTTYHFQVTSVDPSSNSISSMDMTFTTTGGNISGIVSDDFSSATLNTSLWTLVDPLGDVVFSLTGHNTEDAWANLSVPAEVEHQVHLSGIQAPHLLQPANDTNFEVEVKFESPISSAYQEQGVVIKQDDDNFMRFEFYSTASNTFLYASGYTPSTSPNYLNINIGAGGLAPLYMRVNRAGDLWTVSHSFDGDNWVTETPFTHVLAVTGLGPYSGNAIGAGSPSHTASIDYFFNTASPIIPEDPVDLTPSTMAANTSGVLGLSTANPCEAGVPVEIVRSGTENVRGFSATVHLTNLDLCNGIASIQEGPYLGSGGGVTTFQVIDNLDGTYTVDSSILDEPCGATDPTGVLFTLDVTHTVGDGTGTIDLTDLELRDCGNMELPAASGGPASIVIDTTPPVNVTGLTATQVLAGNPAGNVTAINLTWTPSTDATAVQTVLYRKGFGGYPEYDDAGGETPVVPTDPLGENWEQAAALPATEVSLNDTPTLRDYWYFCAVSTDLYGNQSASLITGGVLNYLLGDVSDGGNPIFDGDNHVGIPDVTLLGSAYGTSDGHPLYLNTLDVGPTVDLNVFGLPTTDDTIEFEDLMIFSINFDLNASAVAPAPFMASAPPPADRNGLDLGVPDLPEVGQTFTVDLEMVADGQVQGLKIPLQWDHEVVEFIAFQGGPLLTDQGGQSLVLSAENGVVDIALVGVRERGISGEGTLARATFRVVGTGAPGLGFGDIAARDKANRNVAVNGESTSDDTVLPRVSVLNPNYPNPFNPMTTVSFDLATQGRVRISIFSIDGRLVKTLVDEVFIPGRHERVWQGRDNNGRAVASGTYLYRMVGPGIQQTRRMLLIK